MPAPKKPFLNSRFFVESTSNRSTGGVTGSVRVEDSEGHHWQRKPSLLYASALNIRKQKAASSDRENFGEVIASRIAQALSDKDHVPDVQLVYDEYKEEVLIASKYFTGDNPQAAPHKLNGVQTLDDYVKSNWPLNENTRHAQFVTVATNPAKQVSIDQIAPNLMQDIAMNIALSAAVGDHDINPGNMLFIEDRNAEGTVTRERIARIDFGHAFNDLIQASSFFGGKLVHKNNRILDFLNREMVGGFPKGDQSKLWRDYPGLVPSQYLVSALLEIGSKGDQINQAIADVKNEFLAIYEATTDKELKKHIIHSLKEIYHSTTGHRYKNQDSELINSLFREISLFVKQNCTSMVNTAALMQFQIEIDTQIKNKSLADNSSLRSTYETLGSPTAWIKTEASAKAFTGNLNQYIAHREKVLEKSINQSQSYSERLSEKFEDISESRSRSSSAASEDANKFKP